MDTGSTETMGTQPVAHGIGGREIAVLVCLLFLLVVLFLRYGTPLGSDGYYYFVYLPSLVLDGDLNFANQYTEATDPYGLREAEGKLPPNPFPVGAAVLWLPFFLVGHLAAVISGVTGPLPGYGPFETHAVAVGSVLCGCLAIFLTWRLARDIGSPRTAALAALGVGFGSFLLYYTVAEPSFSHAPSAFTVALFLFVWWRWKHAVRPRRAFFLGLVLGIAAAVRPQNALFAVVPGLWWLFRSSGNLKPAGRSGTLRSATMFAAGVAVGFLPQAVAWWVLYGAPLTIPQGEGFVRWTQPAVGPVLYSTRHGLFAEAPITLFGVIGLFILLGRRTAPSMVLLAALFLQGYLNAAVSDWWAGAAFGMRRFSSAIPILGVGLSVFLDAFLGLAERHARLLRRALVWAFVLFFVWLNGEWIILYRRGGIPGNGTWSPGEALAAVAGERFNWLYRRVGNPFSFPANWLFALQHHTSPARYDRVVGMYFLYDMPFPGAELNFGRRPYEPFLISGFHPIEADSTSPSVSIMRGGTARALMPLFEPVECDLRLRMAPFFAAPPDGALVHVRWNREKLGDLILRPGWDVYSVRLSPEQVRIGVNELMIRSLSRAELPFSIGIVQEGRYGERSAVRSRIAHRPQEAHEWKSVAIDSEGISLMVAEDGGLPATAEHFDTSRNPWAAWELRRFIEAMADGAIVVGVANGDAARNFAYPGREALESLGCCVDLRGWPDHPYAFIGRKGAPPGTALEVFPAEGVAHLGIQPGDPLPVAVDWLRLERR